MTRENFDIGMDRMIRVFNPYRWGPDQADEYFVIFEPWPQYRWNEIVNQAVTGLKKMPTPYDLRKLAGEIVEGERAIKPTNVPLLAETGCPECHRGMVFFEVVKDGLAYEKYAACDCEAGGRAAKHMVMMSRLSGHPLSMDQVRYRNVMPQENVPF